MLGARLAGPEDALDLAKLLLEEGKEFGAMLWAWRSYHWALRIDNQSIADDAEEFIQTIAAT